MISAKGRKPHSADMWDDEACTPRMPRQIFQSGLAQIRLCGDLAHLPVSFKAMQKKLCILITRKLLSIQAFIIYLTVHTKGHNTPRASSSIGPAETFIMAFFKMNTIESEEILPGTEVMKDHDGIHFIHARNAAHGPVLLPTPSEHSHDPLVGGTFPCAFQKNTNEFYRTGTNSGKSLLSSARACLC